MSDKDVGHIRETHDGLLFFFSGHGNQNSLIFPGGESYKWQFIFD